MRPWTVTSLVNGLEMTNSSHHQIISRVVSPRRCSLLLFSADVDAERRKWVLERICPFLASECLQLPRRPPTTRACKCLQCLAPDRLFDVVI